MAAEPRPLARRVAATFLAPGSLADDVRAGAPWLGPLALTTLVAMIAAAALPEHYFVEQMEGAVNRRGQPVEITSSPAEIARYGRYLAMLSALVGHPIAVLAVTGVIALVFTVLGGGRTPFRDHLALTAHAFLIPALGSLVAIAWGFAAGVPEFVPSLAGLAPGGGSARAVLENLNPFSLWMLVAVAIALARLEPRRSAAASAAILVGLYLLVAAGIASLPGAAGSRGAGEAGAGPPSARAAETPGARLP